MRGAVTSGRRVRDSLWTRRSKARRLASRRRRYTVVRAPEAEPSIGAGTRKADVSAARQAIERDAERASRP